MRARLPIALLVGVALAGPTHAAAAVISGADGDVWNAADPAPTYTIAATRGLQVEWRLEGASGGWTRTRSPVVVTLDRIADGQHVLVARNRWGGDDDDDDEGGGAARRRFSVNTLAPLIEIREPWAGAVFAQGQVVAARYSCADAVICAGPVLDGQPVPTDRGGPASFVVRAADAAGNESTAGVDYAVAPSPAPASPSTAPSPAPVLLRRAPAAAAGAAPRLERNHKRLSPAAGSRVRTRRPLLRWRSRGGTRMYNVQVFSVRGASVRKVLSAFPASPRLRVPPRTLDLGERYYWRVWPYLRGGYPKEPIGVSFFDVRER